MVLNVSYFSPRDTSPSCDNSYTIALLSGCVNTYMIFNNQIQCKLMMPTIALREKFVIIFCFSSSGELLLKLCIWGKVNGGGFGCCWLFLGFIHQEPAYASSLISMIT